MSSTDLTLDDRAVVQKIEDCIFSFVQSLINGQKPMLYLESLDGRKLHCNGRSSKKFCYVLRVLSEVHTLILSNQYSTKRDIYYQSKNLFGDQGCLNRAVTDVCQLMEEPRPNLHILSTAKGCIMGDLCWKEPNGSEVDCSLRPLLISNHIRHINDLRSNAKFILVVEKDATYQKLVDEGFLRKMAPCILITGKGYPDICTRQMIKRLSDEIGTPICALMDADPHGIEILVTYKYGPKGITFENRHLEIPAMQWIGLFRTEANSLPLSQDQFIKMEDIEYVKVQKLKERAHLLSDVLIMKELSELERSGTKLEIEAISGLRPYFLSDHYLPAKLKQLGITYP